MTKRVGLVSFVGAIAVFCAAGLAPAQQPQISPDVYNEMKFRYIGPVGNRATAVAGIPGNPNVYYLGAASGGIFKSTDGGIRWDPIFDDQPVSSIGSLAVAASDANIVWAGTGESFIRSHISVGSGIYKSLDAGKTWKLMGLEKTGRIGNVVIDAHNPDIVLACALGHTYGPQPERGVFRTTDGGKTGKKFCSSTRTPVAPTWAWIPIIRVLCLQECGNWKFTPMAAEAADPAADCSSPRTRERRGNVWRVTGCPMPRWGELPSAWRRKIRIAFTR